MNNEKTRYKAIEFKIRTYYHNKIKPYQGRITAGIVALSAMIATLSLAGWIYFAMTAGLISIAGAAVSIPAIIIMGAVIALCIYLVGDNADHHYYHEQNHEHHKHEQHLADHVVDSTHATVQSTLNANPTTTPFTATADVSPPDAPSKSESSSSSGSPELNNIYDHQHTVAEDRAPSPD